MDNDTNNDWQAELTEYKIFDLERNSLESSNWKDWSGESVELYGQTDNENLLSIFAEISAIANEITYRPDINESAYLIFTLIPDDQATRPVDVIKAPKEISNIFHSNAK